MMMRKSGSGASAIFSWCTIAPSRFTAMTRSRGSSVVRRSCCAGREALSRSRPVASGLVDKGVDTRVMGVGGDGSGYGSDGHVWGGEFLVADLAGFERVGHFEEMPLPGGDAAIREPWRMAAVFLQAVYGDA